MSPRQLKLPIAGLLEKARLRVHVFVLRLFVIKARLRDQHRVRAILHHFHVLNFDQFRLRFRDVSRRQPRVLGHFREEFFFVRGRYLVFDQFTELRFFGRHFARCDAS